MKAMLVRAYGGDAVFEASEVDPPDVKAGHVRVRIAASISATLDHSDRCFRLLLVVR